MEVIQTRRSPCRYTGYGGGEVRCGGSRGPPPVQPDNFFFLLADLFLTIGPALA